MDAADAIAELALIDRAGEERFREVLSRLPEQPNEGHVAGEMLIAMLRRVDG